MGQLMAADWRTLKLEVLAETKQFVKGMGDANKQTDSFGDKLGDFAKKAGIALAAAGVAAGVFALKLGKDSVEAAIKAQAEQNRLTQILLTTNGATKVQIGLLDDQANALEKLGVVSGGNIKVVQAQLATFDLSFASIKRLTPAILDYVTAEKGASASADDFKSATNGLAQALQGNFASLTKTGFVLDDTTKELIKNGTESERSAALVKVLDSTYKDFNSTLLGTTEGRLQNLRNQYDNLKVTIGNFLLPAFEKFTGFLLTSFFPALERNVLPIVKSLTEFFETRLVPIIQQYLIPILNNLRMGFTLVSDSVKNNEGALSSLITMFRTIFDFADKYLVPIIKYQLTQAISGLGLVFKAVAAIALPIIDLIAKAITFLVKSIDAVIQKINGLIKAYNSIPLLPNIPTIGTTARASGSNTVPSSSLPFGGASVGGSSASGSSSAIGAGAVAVAAASAASVAASAATTAAIKTLVPSGAAIPSNFDVAAARRGEERGNVIVNVNAPSAIDEEGFTRAVVLALNQTQARTGGGGSQLVL
jgi:hypothetical protein